MRRRLPGSNSSSNRREVLPAPGKWLSLLLLAAATAPLAGCRRETDLQSVTNPASEPAARIADLWWLLFGVCSLVFVATMSLLLLGIFRRPRGEETPTPPLGGTRFVVLSGIVIPAIILTGFLFATMETTKAVSAPNRAFGDARDPVTIQVTGYQFWWKVHYPDHNITLANELQIPVGQPIRLQLTSGDVIHSFWVPRLHGKMDLVPGHQNTFWIAADQPGAYRGQCAEFCGVQHAKMAFWVVALPPQEFERWLVDAKRPPLSAADPQIRKGREAFFRTGCQQCHAIAGTPARGVRGPSLTRMGERLTIGAGTLPNTYGNLQGWIANPQAIKPGNRMPRMYVPPNDLHAIAAYLQSLK